MSLYKTFKTDTAKENDGVPFTYDPNSDGSVPTFFVGRQSRTNTKYKSSMKRLSEPHKRKLEMGALDDKTAEKLVMKGFVQGCLRSWENIQDEDGNNVEFTEANAIKLFTDLPDLFEDLQTQSNQIANYRAESLEEDAKN